MNMILNDIFDKRLHNNICELHIPGQWAAVMRRTCRERRRQNNHYKEEIFSFRKKVPPQSGPISPHSKTSETHRRASMYARTNAGSTHGDFQDRNGVNYVTSAESFGHCSQLFWKKDPNDSGVREPHSAAAASSRAKRLHRCF